MKIKNIPQLNTIVTFFSIVVTTISIVISVPSIGIDFDNANRTVMTYGLPIRVVFLFLIEGTLAYGFGFLFFLIGNAVSTTFESPTAFLLNILTAIVSSWVTFFNIELFVSGQSTLRFFALIFWGVIFGIFGLLLLYYHLEECENYDSDYSFAVVITQAIVFFMMFLVITSEMIIDFFKTFGT